jgi:ATP-dependent DNA helicase RecG
MKLLDSPVSALPSIGPKYKKLLENLDIFTVNDLLFHIPFRYEDYSQTLDIKDVQPNQPVTVKAVLGPVNNIFTRNGKKLTKATAADYSGNLELIWFNQHYIKNTLTPGVMYAISGKVTLFDRKPTIIAPQMEIVREESLNTGRLVPIYPETEGLSSKWLRARINDLLERVNRNNELEETLPQEIKEKNNLKDLNWSLNTIHFPETIEQVKHARYRLEFEELFYDLLKVEKRKREWNSKQKSLQYREFGDEMSQFEKSLPFELTDSQKSAINEIIADLLLPQPMNRLLEGDVGTGKTVVAVVAAYLTHLNQYKTVYLAPTEILANQHFETFSKLLAKTDAKVALMTGSNKKYDSDASVIIGTHALLYNSDIFDRVGLVVIDEQHRFGVEQRGKMLELSKTHGFTPNLLSMTATPIPRTLALTLYGDLALSTLKTHPHSGRQVVTKVVRENQRSEIYSWINEHNLATFIVCPFIETSEKESLAEVKAAEDEYKALQKGVFKNVPMGLIHGKMKSADKQKVIDDFRLGEIKVLVATPVIEVGIDIPDATVIVIEGAERYGLASLHQLRGRVGRLTGKGFCFLFMTNYSEMSYARLKNLEDVNNGLQLAEIDMKLRGQGDIFSTMQHGYKKFKIASLNDFALLERAKHAAEEVYDHLDNFPLVKNRVADMTGDLVKSN